MFLRKYIVIFISVCFFVNKVSGQNTHWSQRMYVEANYHYGYLMPHSDFISYFVKEHIQGLQLNVGFIATGDKSWHHSYNFPRIGLGFHSSNLSNRDVYGQMNALFAYADRYYFNWNSRFNFGNRIAFGAAYINKKFDLHDNRTNLAIGSKLNAYINYSIETLIRINPYLDYKLGGGITHVSNGNISQPNKGLNFFTAFTGLTYTFHQPEYILTPTQNDDEGNYKHQFSLITSFGRKQISRKYNESFTVVGLSGEYSHLIARNSWGGAALSIYHDPSIKREIELSDSSKVKFSDKIQLTFNLVYELKMGRISYVFQPGFYLKNAYTANGSVINKLALRYQLNKNLTAGVTIKAHWFAIADLFEWSFAYRWKK